MSNRSSKGFNVVGCITAVAGLITAIGGLIAILNQTGMLDLRGNQSNGMVDQREYNDPNSSNAYDQLEHLSKEERSDKEGELLKRIAELENKIKQQNNTSPTNSSFRLSGRWVNSQNSNIFYSIEQYGNTISIQEQMMYFGVATVTAGGTGVIDDRNITIDYTTLMGTSGRMNLSISSNGNQLNGNLRDNYTGVSQPISLYR